MTYAWRLALRLRGDVRGVRMSEIRNKESIFGTEKNSDGSPVKEVVNDNGDVVQTVENKEGIFGTEKNSDGTPIKEVKDKD
jgi:hypothetical protein